MDTLLIAGLTLLASWLAVEIIKSLLRTLEQTIVATGSIFVALATIYTLFTLGIL